MGRHVQLQSRHCCPLWRGQRGRKTRRSRNLARLLKVVLLAVPCRPLAAEHALRDLLDCNWDSEWASFRRRLVDNAEAGFPLDGELLLQAQGLLNKYQDELAMNPEAAYGASPGMQSFFAGCNTPPDLAGSAEPSFCLYGAVAALWLVARSGHPERTNLLAHAEFLLGSTMRSTLDFMESSGWPISSLDVLANLQRPSEDFRLPGELLQAFQAPHGGTASSHERQVHHRLVDAPVRIVVWEIGVHASLSAEPLQMWARFIPRAELMHRNLIQDQYPQWLPDRCETLYGHPRLTCDTVEDDITELFRRRMPHSATSKDPIYDIDGFASEFAAVASAELHSLDVFLCTVAYLCILVEKLSMPVLGYFGHPLLFMVPQDTEARESFWRRFASMSRSSSMAFAVSDPFLQMQFEYQLGSPRLPAIRTHALYTGATHFPARASEVLVMDRPHECVLMCLLQRLLPEGPRPASIEDEASDGLREDTWPLHEGRLRAASSSAYPYRFITRALTDRRFSTFAQFRAVVLWPYDMDLITFYEFYSMNMPIFMPSHLPKYLFQQDHMNYDGRWTMRREYVGGPAKWPQDFEGSPFNETSLDSARLIVGFTDYFRFPEVQHFASIPDLLDRLPSTNFFEVVQAMARFNQDSLVESANAWRALLRRATGWDAELLGL